ncbi:Protein N-acetyltransferase, RimJ/RimL family [Polaromonas sp. OV174]|uniref:GNAT family N-acetyltransferase n=1 Tax=Polaromonas sp. OV174 TaxID=1855300 RepID=UPI0008F28FD0|nr:GNAT family N-acetyltransferase [Polaromonas sp. OV174]SFC28726.1 Protein N-acetyltransferase, RimJ/RimL family [Polaromonas sp. OV174]
MSIRRLTPSDAVPYRALRLRSFHDHPEAFTSSYEEASLQPLAYSQKRLAATSSAQFWGAFVHDQRTAAEQLVGCVGLDREQRIKSRHKAVVIGMYVAPEHARRGLARALLDALLTEARASDLELLVLTVTRGNREAEALYLRAGFVPYGIEPGAIKIGHQRFDKQHMFLQLVSS